jgi:diguanylate cyclase (GGDEF)-like protein
MWSQSRWESPLGEEVCVVTTDLGLEESDLRLEAARRAFECELPGTPQEFVERYAEAESQGWAEVSRASLYGILRHAAEGGGDPHPAIEELRERAEVDGDDDTLALALAWRGFCWIMDHDPRLMAAADDDLARAAVMLETPGGNPVIRATTHFRLAFSFLQRRLWELADEQYAAAEVMVDAVDPYVKDPLLHRAALAFNRVMVQLDWASALREAGDLQGVQARRKAQVDAIAAAECHDMPEGWRQDIAIAALVLDAMAGAPRVADLETALAEQGPEGEWSGALHLALSLLPDHIGVEAAAKAAEAAIEGIDAADMPAEHDLALHQATVLEAARAGVRTAGLRSAEALISQRNNSRVATLTAMRSLIAAERLRSEHDTLARHAYLDHLTGLANRRSFDRHVGNLQAGGADQVAMLLFDVDHFKLVNDRYGHAAGDAVLRRLSDVLTANVRSGDFAARFGGDEFVLLLGDSGQPSARRRSEAIAAEIAAQDWSEIDPNLHVTVSVGVASGHPAQLDALTARADTALYEAKAGRTPLGHSPAA